MKVWHRRNSVQESAKVPDILHGRPPRAAHRHDHGQERTQERDASRHGKIDPDSRARPERAPSALQTQSTTVGLCCWALSATLLRAPRLFEIL
ncbi:hypothetical protein PENSPDRAFT_82940 [Peniophora sp. CONT]|nr:hypothetical protein PENSPDRAFT_82940 [Peniophora sp. CONT]